MSKSFTLSQVQSHNSADSLWVIINGGVYDLTTFASSHPGGKRILEKNAGKDTSKLFATFHSQTVLKSYAHLRIGWLAGEGPAERKSGGSSQSFAVVKLDRSKLVPLAEPYWYYGKMTSPYYKPTHIEFRDRCRTFVDQEILPYVNQWDESKDYPRELHEKAYKAGILGAMWPKEYGGTPPKDCDVFHDFVMFDELSRSGCGGLLMAVFFSFNISLPPVIKYGTQFQKDLVARDVITGKKIMSLAVTEPYAGSDVAGLSTVAIDDGDYFILSGEKKFITSGTKAHFMTVAARTDSSGGRHGGVSLLLVDTSLPGVSTRRMKTQGWWISSTAFVSFDKVRVHKKFLIGKRGHGFKMIMTNFNHERWGLAVMSNRYARCCLEDAILYAQNRKTFGKPLIKHQVIRHKIANMARYINAVHHHLENLTYQMQQGVSDRVLGGPLAAVKVNATKCMLYCANEASQVLGGASYILGGVGARIERCFRQIRANAVGGGSEEILLDLLVRQARL